MYFENQAELKALGAKLVFAGPHKDDDNKNSNIDKKDDGNTNTNDDNEQIVSSDKENVVGLRKR